MSAAGLAALGTLLLVLAAIGLVRGPGSGAFLAAMLIAFTTIWVAERRLTSSLDRRLRGLAGEQRVGAVLDGISEHGWYVLHDVDSGRGNIDHVVVGPGGLFSIETKSHRGFRSVDRIDPAWLRQAYAQKRWLQNVTGTPADCLLVFSDAYLDPQFSRRNGVLVLPARSLAKHLLRRRAILDGGQAEAIYRRLCLALDSFERS